METRTRLLRDIFCLTEGPLTAHHRHLYLMPTQRFESMEVPPNFRILDTQPISYRCFCSHGQYNAIILCSGSVLSETRLYHKWFHRVDLPSSTGSFLILTSKSALHRVPLRPLGLSSVHMVRYQPGIHGLSLSKGTHPVQHEESLPHCVVQVTHIWPLTFLSSSLCTIVSSSNEWRFPRRSSASKDATTRRYILLGILWIEYGRTDWKGESNVWLQVAISGMHSPSFGTTASDVISDVCLVGLQDRLLESYNDSRYDNDSVAIY